MKINLVIINLYNIFVPLNKFMKEIINGDVFDIGQTINGVSKFLWLNGKWHYFEKTINREYEYSNEEITKLIVDDYNDYGHDGWCNWIGNIFINM